MRNVLVTGGAGYIGSHACKALAAAGYVPIVYDDLSNGHREFACWGPFVQGDVRDRARLNECFARYQPVGVLHFAGLIEVGASVHDPVGFMDINVGGSATLFAAAAEYGCEAVVFSSTCATYGIPQKLPLTETHPQKPINPYGLSKLLVERMLVAHDGAGVMRSACLRYFNAAGADSELRVGERHDPETHLLPLLLEVAHGQRATFTIFGDDYDTPDGTCLRDFVHVDDLADAHVKALAYLLAGGNSFAANLGSGTGTSVHELMALVREIEGVDIPHGVTARRPGDAPELVADTTRARSLLGWEAKHDLRSIVETASRWHASIRKVASLSAAS